MTPDPLTAALDQLAACREYISRLDAREAGHFASLTGQLAELTDTVTAIGQTLQDETAALTRLETLQQQVTRSSAQPAGSGTDGSDYQPGLPPAWWKLTSTERQEPAARLRAWVDQVYRPGYGHLAATLGRCWQDHDLCLYGLDILSQLWSALYLQDQRTAGLLSAQAEYQARILPALASQFMTETTGCGHDQTRRHPAGLPQEHAMNDATLRQALACGARGWPVFPCQPGRKTPATRHGYRDATADEQQITAWFGRHPGWNLAIATGAPGPDVLDVDQHGHAGSGFPAFARLHAAGLLDGAVRYVRSPGGGLHIYFNGSGQRSGHLPGCHLDFLSGGGYILAPPSRVRGRSYERLKTLDGRGGLAWPAVVRFLESDRQPQRRQDPAPRQVHEHGISRLARWVAAQPEGNRNAGLFWAANRALETDPAADLSPLAAAARQAGLDGPEITRTLDSARRTGQACPATPGREAEGTS